MSEAQKQDLSDSIIVFLDIDGVLLPFQKLLFPEAQLEAFSTILQNFDNVKVVLSSTWRVQPKFIKDIVDQFQQYAYQYGGPLSDFEFFGITDPTMHSERRYEIDAWLLGQQQQQQQQQQQRSAPQAWIAIDDEDLLLGGTQHCFHGHFVQTDSHDGLTNDKARFAIQLLQAQLNA